MLYTEFSNAHRFFHLNLVDLDSEEFVGEVSVEGEPVEVGHLPAARQLVDHTSFAARQRLQGATQLTVLGNTNIQLIQNANGNTRKH